MAACWSRQPVCFASLQDFNVMENFTISSLSLWVSSKEIGRKFKLQLYLFGGYLSKGSFLKPVRGSHAAVLGLKFTFWPPRWIKHAECFLSSWITLRFLVSFLKSPWFYLFLILVQLVISVSQDPRANLRMGHVVVFFVRFFLPILAHAATPNLDLSVD